MKQMAFPLKPFVHFGTLCMSISLKPRHARRPFSSMAAKSIQPANSSSLAQMHHSVRLASSGRVRARNAARSMVSRQDPAMASPFKMHSHCRSVPVPARHAASAFAAHWLLISAGDMIHPPRMYSASGHLIPVIIC